AQCKVEEVELNQRWCVAKELHESIGRATEDHRARALQHRDQRAENEAQYETVRRQLDGRDEPLEETSAIVAVVEYRELDAGRLVQRKEPGRDIIHAPAPAPALPNARLLVLGLLLDEIRRLRDPPLLFFREKK